MTSILFVCYGNVCRSPMAECVMTHLVKEAKAEHRISVQSAGTGDETAGIQIHQGTRAKLECAGMAVLDHSAVQITPKDYEKYDYILGMDEANVRDILEIVGEDAQKKVSRLLDFSSNPRDIADPWYTKNFDPTFADILEGCQQLLQHILNQTTGGHLDE